MVYWRQVVAQLRRFLTVGTDSKHDTLMKNKLWKVLSTLRGDELNKYQQLKKSQYKTGEQVRSEQRDSLKDIIAHSYNKVPYYRQAFDSTGIITDDGRVNLDQFGEIPLLTKNHLKDRYDDLIADDIENRDTYINRSGGSTGEPTKFVQDDEYSEWNKAMKLLTNEWGEYHYGKPRIRLWGSERDVFKKRESLKSQIGGWIRNEKVLDCFEMDSEKMKSHTESINEFKPAQIYSYSDAAYELSKFIDRNQLNVHSPNTVMTTAGTLLPHMRDKIESVFNTTVINRYGSREMGAIATECSTHNGLHIAAPNVFVEILSEDGTPVDDGEVGDVVITSLRNYSMPLIRYKIGDKASGISQCNCDRGWPVLENIVGRTGDTILLPGGKQISPYYFVHTIGVVMELDWIEKYQIIQKEPTKFIIKIIAAKEIDRQKHNQDLNEIKSKVLNVVGEDCDIQIKFVEKIDRDESGKYRYTISEVENTFYES
ncbi:phenylacetate--CoA ligase family protein [Natronococcus roseus]|uniref:phenylacetate--CoA ligase family protein n=1 Tax=Natronococcus roseus TaxID=1052014 RepID=UPI00374CFDDA